MRDSNNLPFLERPDLSPFLVHLTKNTKIENGCSAFDNLVNILRKGVVRGSDTTKGFIKGPHGAACFMDIPFFSLKYVLNAKNTDRSRPRYEPYGIVVSKAYAYDRGCRPVLYLSNEEVSALKVPRGELWRVVRFEGADGYAVNWVHEREWRSKRNFELPSGLRAVLVKTPRDAERLRKLIDVEPHRFASTTRSIIPMTVLCQGLPYLQK